MQPGSTYLAGSQREDSRLGGRSDPGVNSDVYRKEHYSPGHDGPINGINPAEEVDWESLSTAVGSL